MHARSASRRSLGALGVSLTLLLLGLTASSAVAATGHHSAGQFGTPNSLGPGGISNGGPSALAIRQSTGDVYVADNARFDPNIGPVPRIERFDATGGFQSAFTVDPNFGISSLAFDPTGAGSVYAGGFDNNFGVPSVVQYTAAGVLVAPLSAAGSGTSFSYPVIVAVDSADGTVFVNAIDDATQTVVVDTFDNTGAFTGSFDGSNGHAGFQSITGLAVGGSGHVYVSDTTANQVNRYDTSGAWQATVDDGVHGPVGAVTADTASDQVYVVENPTVPPDNVVVRPQIAWYSAGGATRLETFGAGSVTLPSSVGVNNVSDTVYVGDPGPGDVPKAVVDRFTTFTGPTVVTTAPAAIDANSETLNGTINPGGTSSSYHFEYSTDPNYMLSASTAEIDAGSGSAAVPQTDTAAGLTPNTQYYSRLVGTNATGTIYGNDQRFTTLAAAPTVDVIAPNATAITSTGATLNDTINPNGTDTDYHFEYGTTIGYGTSAPNPDATIPAAQAGQPATASITGLTPSTTYHFRINATNGTGGTITGNDQTFTTAPAAPAGATGVTGAAATLTGTVNPHGSAATYRFEYGTTTGYGLSTDPKSAGAGNGDTTVTSAVTGLQPGTTYHVHVIATDTATGVTTTGDDGTFTTDPAPDAVTGAVAGVTTDHATFSGSADTHGLGGSYQFLVASSTSTYQSRTDPVAIGTSASAAGAVADLLPGGTYTVRLAVTSSGVTTFGDEVTFTTAPLAPVAPSRPSVPSDPYGCTAPSIAPYNPHPKPGDTITITGADLGVGGNVMLGTDSLTPTSWSATGFSVTLPDDATGTLPLTANCGVVTNTIAIAMYKAPSNTFTATAKTKGSTATVSVKVPGPGSISIKSGNVKTATKHASKAGTDSVKVTLTAKAVKSLKKHKKLSVTLTVRFTPTGGTAASKSVKVTFKR